MPAAFVSNIFLPKTFHCDSVRLCTKPTPSFRSPSASLAPAKAISNVITSTLLLILTQTQSLLSSTITSTTDTTAPTSTSLTFNLDLNSIVPPAIARDIHANSATISPPPLLVSSNNSNSHSSTTSTTNRKDIQQRVKTEKQNHEIASDVIDMVSEQSIYDFDVPVEKLRSNLNKRKLSTSKQLDSTLNWILSYIDDPYTRYLSKYQLEAMQSDIQGSMYGVGILFTAESKYFGLQKKIVIKQVVPNSPAFHSGLKYGDEITAIDMINIKKLSFDDITNKLLGNSSSSSSPFPSSSSSSSSSPSTTSTPSSVNRNRKILISFKRKEKTFNVLLERKKFEVPTVSYELINNISYIQIREFALNTCKQINKILRELFVVNGIENNIQVIVLDLRGNAGGLVDKSIEICKLFLNKSDTIIKFLNNKSEIVNEVNDKQIESLNNENKFLKVINYLFFKYNLIFEFPTQKVAPPILILVDNETASASELLALSLRDNCKGLVIGRNTFGKNSIQAIIPLNNDGGLAITIAKYRSPVRNENIALGNGIKPDWIKDDIGDEGHQIVKNLFGKRPEKRLKWINRKLKQCRGEKCKYEQREVQRKKNLN